MGDAAARASLAERWGGAIRRAVEREKRAPALIRRAGVVEISLMVDRSGALLSASVAKSAGAPALDEAALAAVRAAAPYPAAPGALGQGPFGFTLPVVFRP
ncbi:MAG: TonB family protein [Pikeienuella sp.]|uniref:TonB family protein n=1 Tax=Pikeienuella sp. TaxID=2831957 RepID=UPI003919C2C0